MMTNKILIFLRSMLGCVWGGSEWVYCLLFIVYCLCRLKKIVLKPHEQATLLNIHFHSVFVNRVLGYQLQYKLT